MAWGVDETVDLYEANDITFQWSTIEESGTEGHPEGEHNHGLINGPDGRRLALHHTLFAHHRARCPAVANGPAEVRNVLAYKRAARATATACPTRERRSTGSIPATAATTSR